MTSTALGMIDVEKRAARWKSRVARVMRGWRHRRRTGRGVVYPPRTTITPSTTKFARAERPVEAPAACCRLPPTDRQERIFEILSVLSKDRRCSRRARALALPHTRPRTSDAMTADLAKFEQELLRRNAALEERAAALHRARGCRGGSVPRASSRTRRATKTLAATHSPSRAPAPRRRSLREAAAYYDEEEENTPPTPTRRSFDDDDEHQSVEDDLDATRGPAFEPPPRTRPRRLLPRLIRARRATFPPPPALLSRPAAPPPRPRPAPRRTTTAASPRRAFAAPG